MKKKTWVSWKKVLAEKEVGGLGVNSLFALNRAMLFKWIWRYFVESEALWVKVVKAIHGRSNNTPRCIKSRLKKFAVEQDCEGDA